MEWSKLKNIILLILLCTNLFLLCLVGLRAWNTASYESAARTDAIQVLARNGITMDKEALPKDAALSTATVSRDREGEAGLLAPLLGEVTEQALGGGQYRYTGTLGEAHFRSRGEFSLSLKAEAYPLSGSLADHAAATLALIGFDATAITVEGNGEEGRVLLVQHWADAPILSCMAEAVYSGGSLTAVTGTRLTGAPSVTGTAQLSSITGLLRFLELFSDTGDVCSRVTMMQAGYLVSTGPSDPATVTPVWYFETDTGAYVLDTIANQLKKL